MPDVYARALLLMQQGRFEQALTEWRRVLHEIPDSSDALAFMSICQSHVEQFERATETAAEAIRHDPDYDLGHYAMALALCQRHRYEEAADAAQEAIRLDSTDPDNWHMLAGCRLRQKRWSEALKAAGEGLQQDPEHVDCLNARASALRNLGDYEAADATLQGALQRDPEDAYSHCNHGFLCLHRGDHRRALYHFRTALRLQPNLDAARAGVVEALKARYLLYRLLLRYAFFMSTLSSRAVWTILIGAYLAFLGTNHVAESNPALAPYLNPLLWLYIVFAVLTWVASPVFNLLLYFNRFGRMALDDDQRREARVVGLLLGTALVSFVVSLLDGRWYGEVAAVFVLISILPIAATFRCTQGWPRRAIRVCAGVLLLALTTWASISLWGHYSSEEVILSSTGGRLATMVWYRIMQSYGWACLISMFAANYLMSIEPRR